MCNKQHEGLVFSPDGPEILLTSVHPRWRSLARGVLDQITFIFQVILTRDVCAAKKPESVFDRAKKAETPTLKRTDTLLMRSPPDVISVTRCLHLHCTDDQYVLCDPDETFCLDDDDDDDGDLESGHTSYLQNVL